MAKKRLAVTHTVNPWQRARPPAAGLVIEAMTDARRTTAALLGLAQTLGIAGICQVCGCTEAAACYGGCTWIDAARTRCSRCAR